MSAPQGAADGGEGAPEPDVRAYEPSSEARARAERAGVDLDVARHEDPETFRMLNAGEIARVSPELAEDAAALVWAAFPDRRIYRVPSGAHERLLAFPPLDAEGYHRFDEAAADLVTKGAHAEAYAFFRTVRDLRGTRRELMLPTPPDAWQGDAALIGPFDGEEEARAWAEGRLPRDLMSDAIPYRGRWFCDVFPNDEAWLSGGGSGGASGNGADASGTGRA